MENYVSAQLLSFLQSILLGLLCGMLYHLLRTLRTMKLRAAWLMHTLDGIYAVLFLLALFLLALQQGDGELRLYMLLGVALGLASYFLFLSTILAPIWRFWIDTVLYCFGLLWRPAAAILRWGKFFGNTAKKVFYFWYKYATINKYKWDYLPLAEKTGKRRRAAAVKQKKTRKKRGGIMLLVVVLLMGMVGFELLHVYDQISSAQAQQQALAAQKEETQKANEELQEDLDRADDPEFLKELARKELGMAEQGEIIFRCD